MQMLNSVIQPYAWGSHTILAELGGRPAPTAQPEAELWLGAHPSAPAVLPDGRRLDEAITRAPEALLGEQSVRRFGPRLPYLLKVLAAERPLSLQAHPDLATARAAYTAGHPSYADANHKPELLVAISPFHALCGFRPVQQSAARFAGLQIAELKPVVQALADGDLRAAVETLLTWPENNRAGLVAAVADRAGDQSQYAVSALLARHYPADMGVVVALLLNEVLLQPGEAIWMPAGNLHAYLRGAGVEIMASSDNVLRGGLTSKRVDVPELLRVLRFEPLLNPILRPVTVSQTGPGSMTTWPVPVDDFALLRLTVDGETMQLDPAGPRTLLCLRGQATVADDEGTVELERGRAAFSAAGAGQLRLTGAGEIYLATTGR
jgi:mannose-6-phosphate isomerase